jgi:hypothetical protein
LREVFMTLLHTAMSLVIWLALPVPAQQEATN